MNLLCIETCVQKDFSQKSSFWKECFWPKNAYLKRKWNWNSSYKAHNWMMTFLSIYTIKKLSVPLFDKASPTIIRVEWDDEWGEKNHSNIVLSFRTLHWFYTKLMDIICNHFLWKETPAFNFNIVYLFVCIFNLIIGFSRYKNIRFVKVAFLNNMDRYCTYHSYL